VGVCPGETKDETQHETAAPPEVDKEKSEKDKKDKQEVQTENQHDLPGKTAPDLPPPPANPLKPQTFRPHKSFCETNPISPRRQSKSGPRPFIAEETIAESCVSYS
jgi:hypothetical protein